MSQSFSQGLIEIVSEPLWILGFILGISGLFVMALRLIPIPIGTVCVFIGIICMISANMLWKRKYEAKKNDAKNN